MAWFYCFLDQMYHLAGEYLKVFVFIHRGMPRRIMFAEDDRDEDPRRRVKHSLGLV